MSSLTFLIAFCSSAPRSLGLSLSSLAWPFVVIALALLIVFSPWGRDIVKITTKFGALERQVADTAQKTEQHKQQLTSQQQEIDKQQRILQKLVQDVARYSISDYIFYLLLNLDQAQRADGEYLYRNDGSMWKNLRFLMDHGYVEEIYPEPADRSNLRGIVKITPAGYALIALRSQRPTENVT
jgi:hypothetical protein